MSHGSDDLRSKFLNAITPETGARATSGEPQQVWRLFVDHPWYLRQLRQCAHLALHRRGMPRQWQQDVEHEAMLLLARKLRRAPHLHIDPSLARRSFAVWLRTIIYRDCLEAIRRLRRLHAPVYSLRETDIVADQRSLIDEQIDVNMAIEHMDEPDRTVLSLYAKGLNVAEIAVALELDYSRAYSQWRFALRELRRRLFNHDRQDE